MKAKEIDAVELKRILQQQAEEKLEHLSEKEQLELLHRKFGHLMQQPRAVHGVQSIGSEYQQITGG